MSLIATLAAGCGIDVTGTLAADGGDRMDGAPLVEGGGGDGSIDASEDREIVDSGDDGNDGSCVAASDDNECTDDICANGATTHPPKAAGATCDNGGTKCDGMGNCLACLAPSDCPGQDNFCEERTCTSGTCGFTYTANLTPLAMQTAGDCETLECDGSGNTVKVVDNSDIPNDDNACTQDLCTMGAPSNPPEPANTSCGTGGLVCNAGGVCVGCNQASDCGTSSQCATYTCTQGACGTQFTAKNTLISQQVTGDCMSATCDGMGNVAEIANDNDAPVSTDMCKGAGCSNGAVTHPSKMNGAPCSDSNACTVGDSCQNGACQAGATTTCTASDACHAAGVCSTSTGLCTNPNKNDGTSCSDGVACTKSDVCTNGVCAGTVYTCTPGDCQSSSSCDGAGGCTTMNSLAGAACTSDSNACTSDVCSAMGQCTHAAVGAGTACGSGLVCDGTSCVGDCYIGGAFYAAGAANPSSACQVCTPGTSTTGWSTKSDGSSCDDGNACTRADVCASGVCGGTAYTCTVTSCETSSACDGTGACTVVNSGSGTACTSDSNACTTDACDGSGTCVHTGLSNGTVCGTNQVCDNNRCVNAGFYSCSDGYVCPSATPTCCGFPKGFTTHGCITGASCM